VRTAGRVVRNSVVADVIRAFVSSTCPGLKAHRASVIACLPAAGILVDSMKHRTAIVADADVS